MSDVCQPEVDFFCILGSDCVQIVQPVVSARIRHLEKQFFFHTRYVKRERPHFGLMCHHSKEFQVIPHGQFIFSCLDY